MTVHTTDFAATNPSHPFVTLTPAPKRRIGRMVCGALAGAALVVATVTLVVGGMTKHPEHGGDPLTRASVSDGVESYYGRIQIDSPDLKRDLHELIKNHHAVSYSGVWEAFEQIDTILECGDGGRSKSGGPTIGDVYSNTCWDSEGDRCGNFHQEGDCFNREHGWPKSWWGGFDKGHNAQTDLFLLFPADGYVNGRRGNFPLGNVKDSQAIYRSSSGAKLGPCAVDGYDGTCFEVPDEYKGDFARSYFYITTRYMGEFGCCDEDAVDGATIKDWMESVLREWHAQDPPSDRERHITDRIHQDYQHNRNPFVDHPEWVDLIEDF